jgi:hypothetical protein
VRDAVRVALGSIAAPFSDDAPSVNARVLRARYGVMDAWPADAELGLVVLAWALGPGFTISGFREALGQLVPDYARAARAIGPGGSPTLITLGGIARCALSNGAIVVRWNLNPEVLYWPLALERCAGATTCM